MKHILPSALIHCMRLHPKSKRKYLVFVGRVDKIAKSIIFVLPVSRSLSSHISTWILLNGFFLKFYMQDFCYLYSLSTKYKFFFFKSGNSSRNFTNSSRNFTNSSRNFTNSSRNFTNSSRNFTNSSRNLTNL